jgi:peptide/nickel transport system substrate-binding protein
MAVAMLVGACSGSTATPTATTVAPGPTTTTAAASPTAAGVKGGTAYLLMTSATAGGDKFTDMDPQRIYVGEDEAFFDATIMQGLTGYKYSTDPKASTSLVPDAATDTGTANADATQWVFTLRNGLKWQDGSPVTCADYKYGVSRSFATDVITNGPASYVLSYLNIPTDAKGNSQYPGPYKATPDQQALYDKAVVCDGNKITFNLKVGVGDFNYATTLGMGAVPNPKDHPGVDKGEQYTNAPWSDGPYMIQSYTPGKGGNLTLVRNPNWSSAMDGGYRGAFPDKWVVSLGLDPTVVDQRLMQPTGNDVYALQYGAIQPENLSTVFKDAKTANAPYAGRAFSDYDVYVRYLWIRTDKVTNVKIRQAMAVALDRAAIQTNNGGVFAGDLADGAIKPNLGQDYAPTGWATDLFGQAIPPNGDPDFAKKLIADSGVPAPTLTYDYSKGPVADKTAAIVKSSLEKAGFKINLNPITSGYYGVINDPAKQHEFGAAGWGADWPNASTVIPPLFTPEGSSAYSRVSDPTWLAAVKAAQADTNRADQASKWQALDKQASQQAFIIPTLFGLNQTMAGTKVGNLYRWTPYGSWPYAAIYVMQ